MNLLTISGKEIFFLMAKRLAAEMVIEMVVVGFYLLG